MVDWDPACPCGGVYGLFCDHCGLCRHRNLLCFYMAVFCGPSRISCLWKMVLQPEYDPYSGMGAGKHRHHLRGRSYYDGPSLLSCVPGAASPQEPGLDYVIVLGARVKEHTISDSLKKRLDRAIDYAQKNPDTYLVLSGGKGKDEPVSEAQAMYQYLVYNGVRPEQHSAGGPIGQHGGKYCIQQGGY